MPRPPPPGLGRGPTVQPLSLHHRRSERGVKLQQTAIRLDHAVTVAGREEGDWPTEERRASLRFKGRLWSGVGGGRQREEEAFGSRPVGRGSLAITQSGGGGCNKGRGFGD